MSCDLSTLDQPAGALPRAAATLHSHLRGLLRLFRDWRHRRLLASLSEGQLRDIGLGAGDIMREVLRPVWEPVDWEELERIRRRRSRTELEAGPTSSPHRRSNP